MYSLELCTLSVLVVSHGAQKEGLVSGKRLSLPLGVETHDAGTSGQATLQSAIILDF